MVGVFRVQDAGVQEIRRDVMSRACPDRTSAPVTSRLAWGSITFLHVVHVHVHYSGARLFGLFYCDVYLFFKLCWLPLLLRCVVALTLRRFRGATLSAPHESSQVAGLDLRSSGTDCGARSGGVVRVRLSGPTVGTRLEGLCSGFGLRVGSLGF